MHLALGLAVGQGVLVLQIRRWVTLRIRDEAEVPFAVLLEAHRHHTWGGGTQGETRQAAKEEKRPGTVPASPGTFYPDVAAFDWSNLLSCNFPTTPARKRDKADGNKLFKETKMKPGTGFNTTRGDSQ